MWLLVRIGVWIRLEVLVRLGLFLVNVELVVKFVDWGNAKA